MGLLRNLVPAQSEVVSHSVEACTLALSRVLVQD
jgi:hypothetical protein